MAVTGPLEKCTAMLASLIEGSYITRCIEAETEEEARGLLTSGHGERGHIGECIHCDVASMEN